MVLARLSHSAPLAVPGLEALPAARTVVPVSRVCLRLRRRLAIKTVLLGRPDGRLASFVRTAAARPYLAALVKHVYVHVYLLRPVAEEDALATLEKAIGATADDYLACFQGMQDKVYIAGVKLVGVMLALFPNLERLSLQTEGPSAYVPAGALSALTGLSKPGPLAKLTTLDICDRALPLGFDYHAGGILGAAAGSLATLNVHISGGPTQKVGQGRLRNLRTLWITHTRLSAAKLAALLDSCAPPGLEAFTYKATYPLANLISEYLGLRKLEQGSTSSTIGLSLTFSLDRPMKAITFSPQMPSNP